MLGTLAALSMAGTLIAGDPLVGARFVTLAWLLMSAVVIGVVGAQRGHRIRRAEFYSRHRLQPANERLARFDHGTFKLETSGQARFA